MAGKKQNISIFAGKVYLSGSRGEEFVLDGAKPRHGYLKRVSAMIRGNQVAEALGAKFNPKTGYKNDVCIYVKPDPDQNGNYKFEGKRKYLDLIDGWYLISVIKEHPKLSVIVCSESDYIYLKTAGVTNKIVIIPQHHCNYKREKRTRKEIKTVGAIGNWKGLLYLPPDLKTRLSERGIELLLVSRFFSRQDIIDFYKSIDVQIVWRPYARRVQNPLKVINAASFGIPTIALEEIYIRETGNCYINVHNLNELMAQLDRLITYPDSYNAYSDLCLKTAERYHISNIVKLYKKL